jgi:hypothetical protein
VLWPLRPSPGASISFPRVAVVGEYYHKWYCSQNVNEDAGDDTLRSLRLMPTLEYQKDGKPAKQHYVTSLPNDPTAILLHI